MKFSCKTNNVKKFHKNNIASKIKLALFHDLIPITSAFIAVSKSIVMLFFQDVSF